jgi:hypothetical protein
MQPSSPASGRQDAPRPRIAHPRRHINSLIASKKLRHKEPAAPPDGESWDDSCVYELGPVFPDEQEWSAGYERGR